MVFHFIVAALSCRRVEQFFEIERISFGLPHEGRGDVGRQNAIDVESPDQCMAILDRERLQAELLASMRILREGANSEPPTRRSGVNTHRDGDEHRSAVGDRQELLTELSRYFVDAIEVVDSKYDRSSSSETEEPLSVCPMQASPENVDG
jgi:hypothetical protein